MVERLPTADDVILVIQKLIAELGAEAFGANGYIQLYSGPKELVAEALQVSTKNHAYAFKQAGLFTTSLIDNTNIGKRLDAYDGSQNIYLYFVALYGTNNEIGRDHANKVMRFASQEFIKAAFGHVATAVCGADTTRVFFEIELPALIANTRIETINGTSMDYVRDIYRTKGAYAAFRKICQAEIVMAFKHAKTENTQEAWDDYSIRRQFFMMERRLTIADTIKTAQQAAANVIAIHASLVQEEPTAPAAKQVAGRLGGAHCN